MSLYKLAENSRVCINKVIIKTHLTLHNIEKIYPFFCSLVYFWVFYGYSKTGLQFSESSITF
jgi:hypothetical protein